IRCQLVLVCTGTTPVVTLARRCNPPLRCERGIVVDYRLRSSVPNIFVAGDAAALWDPQMAERATRAQWQAAVTQGRYAAQGMTDKKSPIPSPFGARWHATHIGDLALLVVGAPFSAVAGAEMIIEDNVPRSYRRMALVGDRLIGYLALGQEQPDGLAIKQL